MTRRVARRRKYGARVFRLGPGVGMIKQTVKSEGRYVLDWAGDNQREEVVDLDDDRAVARVVPRALEGRL